MAKGDLIGFIHCPTCDFPDMQVKEDKNGNPFGYCPDCSQQLPTHGGERGKNLRAKALRRPAAAAGVSADIPAPPEAQKRGNFFDSVYGSGK